MKIAYLLGEDLDCHPGLKQKIESQMNFWRQKGHVVEPVAHGTRSFGPESGGLSSAKVKSSKGRLGTFQRLMQQYRWALAELKRIQPDIVYSRYLFPAPGVAKLLEFPRAAVIEINSDDRSEYLSKNLSTGLYNLFMRGFSLRHASGFVCVTNELAESNGFLLKTHPRIVLPNGVDAQNIPYSLETQNATPKVVFVGSPNQAWQGFDKIRILAERIENVEFHIVGPSVSDCSKIFGENPINVVCHGYLPSDELSHLLVQMDFGLGSLALHRKKMNEACPLKVRQYLAHGLPVIAGYPDTDIIEPKPFFLRLANCESNVEDGIEEIRNFINSGFQSSELRRAARLFAETHLSNEAKEIQRLNFFESLVSR